MIRRPLFRWIVGVLGALVLCCVVLVLLAIGLVLVTARTPTRPTGKVPIEFRILADRRRDQAPVSQTAGPDGLGNPPAGYRWVKLDARSGLENDPNAFIRVDPETHELSILIKLDRYNVRETHMSDVYPTLIGMNQSAIGFSFDRQGAERFGALTRTHLPE